MPQSPRASHNVSLCPDPFSPLLAQFVIAPLLRVPCADPGRAKCLMCNATSTRPHHYSAWGGTYCVECLEHTHCGPNRYCTSDKGCAACHADCLTCDGPDRNDCLSCNASSALPQLYQGATIGGLDLQKGDWCAIAVLLSSFRPVAVSSSSPIRARSTASPRSRPRSLSLTSARFLLPLATRVACRLRCPLSWPCS